MAQVVAVVYHVHVRADGEFVPRPALWGANVDGLAAALKSLRVPRERVRWDKVNTDTPAYVAADGTAVFIFKTELTR